MIDPVIEAIRKTLDYDPETGLFRWKRREGTTRGDKIFNGQFVGKPAITADCGLGYRQGVVFGKTYRGHILAWAIHYGEWQLHLVHIDGDRSNNRISNLRKAGPQRNSYNRGKNINNSSGYKGVWFCNTRQTWKAGITANGVMHHLGAFPTAEAAADAYDKACAELHRDFAKHNGEGIR